MAELKEQALLFGRNNSLLGIQTEPVGGPRSGTSIVIPNSGIIHRVGPSRFVVELARFLAAHGHRVLRFDLSGIGDSPSSKEGASADEIARRDLLDAIDLSVKDGSCWRVILLGLCSGADDAIATAPLDERVAGLALIDPTVHETDGFRRRRMLRRLKSAKSWWSVLSGRSVYLRVRDRFAPGRRDAPPPELDRPLPTLEEQRSNIRAIVDRGGYFLYIITGGLMDWCNHPIQVIESLPDLFDPARLRLEWRPEGDHIFSGSVDRAWLQDTVLDWINGIEAEEGASSALSANAV